MEKDVTIEFSENGAEKLRTVIRRCQIGVMFAQLAVAIAIDKQRTEAGDAGLRTLLVEEMRKLHAVVDAAAADPVPQDVAEHEQLSSVAAKLALKQSAARVQLTEAMRDLTLAKVRRYSQEEASQSSTPEPLTATQREQVADELTPADK